MKIKEGPIKVDITDSNSGSHELHLDFTDEFRALMPEKQSEEFHEFLLYLRSEIDVLEEHDPNKQSMMTLLQICEQLQPGIDSNDIPLNETIIINM